LIGPGLYPVPETLGLNNFSPLGNINIDDTPGVVGGFAMLKINKILDILKCYSLSYFL